MNIVYCTDDNYALYALISIISCIEHNNKPNIYLLYSGINFQYDLNIINELYDYEAIKLINISPYYNIRLCHPMAYVRYLIPEIFSNLDKVLYIDIDTIILKDLTDLYNIDVECIGACDSIKHYNDTLRDNPRNLLGLFRTPKQYEVYYNTGVLLFNIKYWNDNNITQKLINEQNMHPDILADQDAFNTVLNDKVTKLPIEYNYKISYWSDPKYIDNLKEKGISLKEPVILHYASKIKPWHNIAWKGPWIEYYNKIVLIYNLDNIYSNYTDILIDYLKEYKSSFNYRHIYNMCYNSPFKNYIFPRKTVTISDDYCDDIEYKLYTLIIGHYYHRNEIEIQFKHKHDKKIKSFIFINPNIIKIPYKHYIYVNDKFVKDFNEIYTCNMIDIHLVKNFIYFQKQNINTEEFIYEKIYMQY